MKIAVLIIGILGSLTSLGLGGKWVSDASKYEKSIAQMEEMAGKMGPAARPPQLDELKRLVKSGWLMIGLGIVALIASILVFKIPKVSAILLLVAGIVPGILAPKAFVGTFLLIIAGMLAFFAKRKPAPAIL